MSPFLCSISAPASLKDWVRGTQAAVRRPAEHVSRRRRSPRASILLEAGAALLFFGSLAQNPDLLRSGAQAIQELQAQGYVIPTESSPVRVYPATAAGPLGSRHAAGWRPGRISLRENPLGSLGSKIYLRHELMHEASYRTCSGKLPVWAEEAAAMHFSGELPELPTAPPPSDGEVSTLQRKIRIGASLDTPGYETLSKLVASNGWPKEPCATQETLQQLLSPPSPSPGSGFSCILMSLLSGRTLEAKGDLQSRHPPGSLLKIPYAASLGDEASDGIGEELATSDTERLLGRKERFDWDRFRFLLSPVRESSLAQKLGKQYKGDQRFFRQCLGERDETGDFPFQASLGELALVMRASLLFKPAFFTGLARNGFLQGSTLYAETARDKAILEKLHALAKTGTVSDERGLPVVGHLMVAWPAERPVYLALFRTVGASGASNLRRASRILEEWSTRHPAGSGKVRVRLLRLTSPSSRKILDECPSFTRQAMNGAMERISTCGRFRLLSSARGSRSERFLSGVLETSANDSQLVLETDPETYADGVLAMEAQGLKGEAARALRAAIVWNATHGMRHQETSSLCDTTHCMVYQGDPIERTPSGERTTDHTLLDLLDALALPQGLDWLPFSKGGEQRWERQFPKAEIAGLVEEPGILEIRRNRSRTGEISIHLIYPENEEVVPCEAFRNRLKLPSCPHTIRWDEAKGVWVMEGIGEGHGLGLSIERARAQGASGSSALAILKEAYGAR
jgi:hypothetical protein